VVTKRLLHRFRNSLPSCAFSLSGFRPLPFTFAVTMVSTHDLFELCPSPEELTETLAFSVLTGIELSFLLLDANPV
jgi:hypothetical protein